MKRPAFQFYPADWRKDAALQSCSIAARGLWIECMCIAHECDPYGHLTINGKAMTPAQIGRLVGLSAKECTGLLAELDDAGVLSRSDDGTIFSRRMVKDEDLRQRRAAGGEAGSEHGIKGKEYGVKGGRPAKGRGVSEPPIEPPPSSSSSASALHNHLCAVGEGGGTGGGDASPSAPPPAPSRLGTRLDPDWVLPAPWRAWAITERPDLDLTAVADRFRDHWLAKPGKDGRKADWQATWRNWVRRENGNGAHRETAAERNRRASDILDAELADCAARMVVGIQQPNADAVSAGMDVAVVDPGRTRAIAG